MYCLHCKYTTKLRNDKEIDALFAILGGAVVSTAPTRQRTHPNLLCECNLWEDTRSSVVQLGTAAPPERTLAVRLVQLGTAAPPEEILVTAYRKCCYRVPKLLLPQCCKGVTALW